MLLIKLRNPAFLIDIGSYVSCFPKSCLVKDTSKSDFTLYADNGTKICIYSTKLLTLDLGLKRKLQRPFTIAKVIKPIIGDDFCKI